MLRAPSLPLLVALLALSGCATSAPDAPPSAPTAAVLPAAPAFSEVSHLEERALLLMLEDRRLWEPATLSAYAADPAPEVRERTAVALGRIADPRGAALLASLSADDDVAVRRAAVFALGELGEGRGAGATEALRGSIAAALGDVDSDVGRLAVEAGAKIGQSLEALLPRLLDGPSGEILPRLLPSLWRFDGPSVLGFAEQGLESDDGELRAWAAYALGRNPPVAAGPRLRALLAAAEPRQRAMAARGLGFVGARGDLDRLRPLLDDAEVGPVVQALGAARRLIDRGEAAPDDRWRSRLLSLLDDPRAGVRMAALDAVGAWLLDPEIGALLEELLAGRGGPRERELALLALAEGEDPRAMEWAARSAESPSASMRRAAARAAGLLGRRDLLDRLVEDPERGVRRDAIDVLLRGELDDVAVVAGVALEDPDVAVRATVLDVLTERPILPLDFLGESLERSAADREPDARLAAISAIAARAAAEPTERGEALRWLDRLGEDGERLERRRVAASLEALGETPIAVGARRSGEPVAVFRDIARRTTAVRRFALETARGRVVIEVDCPSAPRHCLAFAQLAAAGAYDATVFHRVVPDFVVQGGDPSGDGSGGPGYTLRDEINRVRFDRPGILGMAHAGADTAGSQFFLTLAPTPHLDGRYTAFGRVTEGLEILAAVVQGDELLRVRELAP
ncbi:MAG: peptidylprolyl isomerase [Acidobacteriota bacterium]